MLANKLQLLGKTERLVTLAAEIAEMLEEGGIPVEISNNWDGDLAAVGLLCNREGRRVLVYLSVWQKPDETVAVEVEDVTTDLPTRLVPMHDRKSRGLAAWILSLLFAEPEETPPP